MVSGGYRNPIVKFKDGKAEEFTIVLCTRDYRRLGQLTGITNLHYASHDNSPNEISFSLTTICHFAKPIVISPVVSATYLEYVLLINPRVTDSDAKTTNNLNFLNI
jgi:hypothetical protein